MASKFQSRLVGTIILVAVGVIVLPDILDGKKEYRKEDVAAIPIKPDVGADVELFEVLEPVEAQTALPESPVQIAAETPASDVDTEQVDIEFNEVEEKNNYQEEAWIIQLMALKNADNAENLVKDLQQRGFQAHVKQEKEFSRVIIGPNVSKSALESQIKELQEVTGSKGQLMKFKPLNP